MLRNHGSIVCSDDAKPAASSGERINTLGSDAERAAASVRTQRSDRQFDLAVGDDLPPIIPVSAAEVAVLLRLVDEIERLLKEPPRLGCGD